MKQLKFSKQTSVASLVFFSLYAIYGLFRIPFVQYISVLVAGGIAYGMTRSYEVALIALLGVNFLFSLFVVCVSPFVNKPEGYASGAEDISRRVRGFSGEGFADASGNEVKGKSTEDGFEADGALFKLGKIPSDKDGGLHIDSGSTVINALKALKPEQISAMTQDTKQLIETQKSLMAMLQTFSPMVSEGKELMNTFNSMFGGSSGAAMTMPKIA